MAADVLEKRFETCCMLSNGLRFKTACCTSNIEAVQCLSRHLEKNLYGEFTTRWLDY